MRCVYAAVYVCRVCARVCVLNVSVARVCVLWARVVWWGAVLQLMLGAGPVSRGGAPRQLHAHGQTRCPGVRPRGYILLQGGAGHALVFSPIACLVIRIPKNGSIPNHPESR